MREHSGIRVLLYGYYNDIYVIDGCSLTHLYSLSSRLSPDWISAVTLVRPIVQAGQRICQITTTETELFVVIFFSNYVLIFNNM